MRKRTEEALDEANQKLRLLTGLTRHDILNQLTAIEGYLYLLSDEKDMALISQYINLARNVCERIKSTIIFTREYEEFGAVSGAWINIRPIIQSAAEEVPFHGITLDNQIPQSLEVFADPIIRKVFSTLLENSVRHGESITKIRFFTEIRQKSLIIVCEDDGVGINASEKELIFEHGYGKNTGIGLFLAKEILSITRLSIIECGETGLGTRFEITVPADKFRL